MITLACDLDILTSGDAAKLSAVLLTICELAAARNVRAFLALLIFHHNSSVGLLLLRSSRPTPQELHPMG